MMIPLQENWPGGLDSIDMTRAWQRRFLLLSWTISSFFAYDVNERRASQPDKNQDEMRLIPTCIYLGGLWVSTKDL